MKQLSAATIHDVLGPLADDPAGLDSEELEQLIDAISQHGRRCIRPRPGLALSELPFETEPVPWSKVGRFLVDSRFRPGSSLQYAAGDYAIQDAASLLPLTLMQLKPGELVCDLCAAPGGKSLAMLEQLAGDGLLLSNEVIASRVDTLQLTLARGGYANYFITNRSAELLAESADGAFDCVLVDAPCTGQSMIARGKQSLSAFSEKQIAHSAARQQSILRAAVQLVRPGGRLVYSTCTFAFAENEAIVAWLQQLLPDWRPLVVDELSAWQTPGFAGCYRLWPHRDNCAGGFAAALLRPHDDASLMKMATMQGHRDSERSGQSRRPAALRAVDEWSPWKERSIIDDWGQLSSEQQLWQRKHRVHWFDPQIPAAWRSIAHAGIEVAAAFGEHWQPSYPLATLASAPAWFQPHRFVELSDSEAVQFLAGAALHRPGTDGWCIGQWRDRNLSWAKQVGTQLKNHLPKPLRQPSLSLNANPKH
jgi:16S rRNA C967 or C1407 C5-methylase (RsmB/RsmF family)/NOL1/NOP2/fmu family ribosome biogenesis protein